MNRDMYVSNDKNFCNRSKNEDMNLFFPTHPDSVWIVTKYNLLALTVVKVTIYLCYGKFSLHNYFSSTSFLKKMSYYVFEVGYSSRDVCQNSVVMSK